MSKKKKKKKFKYQKSCWSCKHYLGYCCGANNDKTPPRKIIDSGCNAYKRDKKERYF